MINAKRTQRRRRGISLIEVIACTALVAFMIVPIAGVIRASGQAISQSGGNASTEAKLRNGLRWLGETVRGGEITRVQNQRLTVLLADGRTATIRVRGGDLTLDDGTTPTVIVEGVRSVRFSELMRIAAPQDRVGITVALQADDPNGGRVTVNSTIAEKTQY